MMNKKWTDISITDIGINNINNDVNINRSKLYFVSAGPGDPKLLTVIAYGILKKSEAVLYAGSLINKKMLKLLQKGCVLCDISRLCFEEISQKMAEMFYSGRLTIVLHSGDSSIYSSINEQMAFLNEKGIDYEIVPGVTAAFAASAFNKSTLTLPGVSQSVIFCRGEGKTGKMPEGQDIKSLASHHATMAIYLSFGLIDSVVADLMASYPENTPCLIAKDISLDSQFLIECELKDVAAVSSSRSIKNKAILIVGEALKGKYHKENRSKLYDKDFSHTFRQRQKS